MIRRDVLCSMLTAAAMTLPVPSSLATSASASAVARNLKELLADLDSARTIGWCHLAAGTTETGFKTLIERVAADGLAIDAPIDQLGSARRRLRARIRQDFAEGRVAVVDGWRLSLTEVRLCTLAALMA